MEEVLSAKDMKSTFFIHHTAYKHLIGDCFYFLERHWSLFRISDQIMPRRGNPFINYFYKIFAQFHSDAALDSAQN